jgi:hypothetical protein
MMKIASILLLVLALTLGALAFRQHGAYRKAEAERFAPNSDGTVAVELFGPGVRKSGKAKSLRNGLAAGATLSVIAGIACFVVASRKRSNAG